jgi:hypothetical protein
MIDNIGLEKSHALRYNEFEMGGDMSAIERSEKQ